MDTPPLDSRVHHYSPVWKCIYCGCDDRSQLTNEHIYPYSLGGTLILDKSSCRKCADITKRYEQTVARDVFGKFRVRHGIQTRKPKDRPKYYTIGVTDPGGSATSTQIPSELHPSPLFLYKFSPASIIYGFPATADDFKWIIYCASSGDADVAMKQYKWDGIVRQRVVPVEFARTLAKIAHGLAVASFGLDAFQPLATDIIRCKADNVSYLIGGRYLHPTSSTDDLEEPNPGAGHLMHFICFRNRINELLLACELRLFASLHSVTYHVIVGKLQSDTQIPPLLEKAIDTKFEKASFPFV